MIYTHDADPLCYPGTTVLRNTENLQTQAELNEFEAAMFDGRVQQSWPDGAFDTHHYRRLHHHFFQDVYDWAGEYRDIRIGKSGNWFCYPEYIAKQMDKLFADLAQQDFFNDYDKGLLVERGADFLSELNAIHPFREGNGRTQLSFFLLLIKNVGHELDIEILQPDVMLQAMVSSFSGDLVALKKLLDRAIT